MLFLLPNFLGFALFTAVPVLWSLGASFTNWTMSNEVPLAWTGSENFVELLHDNEFWLYSLNTLYLMLGLPFAIFGSLLLAMLLSQKLRGMVVYRTLFYLPTFTNGVALIILWKALYNPDFGPINSALRGFFRTFHIPLEPPLWLLSTHSLLALAVEHVGFDLKQFGLGARDAIILMGVWIAIGGNNMLLYLAALTNVPQDLYEAASIDGAGKWKTFWNVTWPQLAPTTFFITIMSFIGGLTGGFEQARVMTQGKPAGTTITLSYYIYIKAFEQVQMGYASAISWALFLIISVITLFGWRFGSRAMGDL
jgi:ABC-type sugar transport system permease subunit